MARKATAISEPNLPWVDQGEDRRFRLLTVVFLVLFLAAGLILNSIKLPEVEKKNLVDVSPRLAKLILEKKKVEPPPPPKPKPEEKKEVEKKQEEPKKTEKKPEKKPEKKETAREVAQKSGLIAMADELADLRDSFALDDVLELPQTNQGKQETKLASNSDLLTSTAGRSSGGIQTDTLSRTITTSELAQRKTTRVESKIESDAIQVAKAETAGSQGAGSSRIRSADEIERVFQKNKSSIFNLYNRALRSNPSLVGQVVVELTIAPDGSVTAVKILSSELQDDEFERKLVLRIKRFKFTRSNVAEITVTYPIDFLPS